VSVTERTLALAGAPVKVTVNVSRTADPLEIETVLVPAVPSLHTTRVSPDPSTRSVPLLYAFSVADLPAVVELVGTETSPGPLTVTVSVSWRTIPVPFVLAEFAASSAPATEVSPAAFLTVTAAIATATGVVAVPLTAVTADSRGDRKEVL